MRILGANQENNVSSARVYVCKQDTQNSENSGESGVLLVIGAQDWWLKGMDGGQNHCGTQFICGQN